ncbi:MAG TPA: molybdate ABC transporter substrate-binding protein [Ideonella sp.]|nr:molybdate ABC transporter substrate-binding protein [Ideonella sp.]
MASHPPSCARRTALRRAAALIAAASLPDRAAAQDAPAVTVFAAASLADVLRTLAGRWSKGDRPLILRLSFAASSTLARQIEQGAPADIFISADEGWMDHVEKRGRIDPASRRVLATNRLVVVRRGPESGASPSESTAALRAALLAGGPTARVATGDPAHVPVGLYARAALERLGLWSEVEPRLVRADNVRSALAFVERGEAAAGIVYATDARAGHGLAVAARFPADSHPPIRYPAALVTGAAPAAREALARLYGLQAQAVLRAAGFGAPA